LGKIVIASHFLTGFSNNIVIYIFKTKRMTLLNQARNQLILGTNSGIVKYIEYEEDELENLFIFDNITDNSISYLY